MPVQPIKKSSNGIMGSPAVNAVMAYYTGGAGAAAASLVGSKNKPLGAVVGSKFGGAGNVAQGGTSDIGNSPGFQTPEIGSQFSSQGPRLGVDITEQDNPMTRRMSLDSASPPADHAAVIEDGLKGLQDLRDSNPDLYAQIAPDVAPAFLEVKHFHLKGGQ